MKSTNLILILVFGTLVSCAQAVEPPTPGKLAGTGPGSACFNIVGGTKTSQYEASVFIGAKMTNGQFGICSGSFIGPNVIATTASCIKQNKADTVKVVTLAGEPSADSVNIDFANGRPVQKLILPAAFHGDQFDVNQAEHRENNLALLIVADSYKSDKFYQVGKSTSVPSNISVVAHGRPQVGVRQIASFNRDAQWSKNTTYAIDNSGATRMDLWDSGGAMISTDGKTIYGIFSSILSFADQSQKALFVSLDSTKSVQMLNQAKAQGAIFSVNDTPQGTTPPGSGDSNDSIDGNGDTKTGPAKDAPPTGSSSDVKGQNGC